MAESVIQKSLKSEVNTLETVTTQKLNISGIANPDASSTINGGSIEVHRYGRLVILAFTDVKITVASNVYKALSIANAVPKAQTPTHNLLSTAVDNASYKIFIEVTPQGQLYSYYTKQSESGSRTYSGQLVYIAES